nr:PREDICTED: uncharacterized protein LOC105675495 [Linepithema humile]
MSEVKITKDNVWEHFKELSGQFFKAKCEICKSDLIYVDFTTIDRHLRENHFDYLLHTVDKKLKKLKMYDNLRLQSSVGDKNISFQDNDYIRILKNMANAAILKNKSEYCAQVDVFTIKCKIGNCDFTTNLPVSYNIKHHFLTELHMSNLREMQTGAMSMPPTIANEREQFMEKYVILTDFQAICAKQSCFVMNRYIDHKKFNKHVSEIHPQVTSYENKNGGEYPWMQFKYLDEIRSQCLHCPLGFGNPPSKEDWLREHLEGGYHNDINRYVHKSKIGKEWEWKYCTKIEERDYHVRCDICRNEIELELVNLTNLNHLCASKDTDQDTELNKPTSTESACDAAGTSGIQPKKKKRE